MRLRQPVASGRRVDGVERAVFYLYYHEDALGIASCYNALVQLYLHGRGSATTISARGDAIITPGLTACAQRRSGLTRRSVVSWLGKARVVVSMLTRRITLPVAPWLTVSIVVPVRGSKGIGGA